jgi:S1-C subfamily serine protease
MRSIYQQASLAVAIFSTALGSASLCQELKSQDLYKKILPSVMTLHVETKEGSGVSGSGFLAIKDGVAVTAWHVVSSAKRVVAKFSSGEEFESSGLIDKDEKRDLALIRVKVFGRPQLAFASADPDVGAKAYAIGAPRGLDFTISEGLISQIRTIDGVKQYQFSCSASPGNSGGPIVDEKGEAVGVVAWKRTDGDNLNFAVPAVYVLGLDASLPTQPWDTVKATGPIGGAGTISTDAFDKLAAEAVVLSTEADAIGGYAWSQRVTLKDGYRLGVPPLVYRLQSSLIAKADELSGFGIADPVRDAVRQRLVDSLRAWASSFDLLSRGIKAAALAGGWNPIANDFLSRASAAQVRFAFSSETELNTFGKSVAFMALLPQDEKYAARLEKDPSGIALGVLLRPSDPLLIMSVARDSLADKIGLRAGDRILSADDRPLSLLVDFKLAVKSHSGERLKVSVTRDGKPKDLNPKIPKDLPPMLGLRPK